MPKLKDHLTKTLLEALATRGKKSTVTLAKGLIVQIYVEPEHLGGTVHLALMRPKVYPSPDEWLTVMRYWPAPLPDPQPEWTTQKWGEFMMLTNSWKPPRAVFGQPI